MAWNKEKSLRLIMLVQKEPCIWNPLLRHNSSSINEAWARILVNSHFMSYSAKTLKMKWFGLLKKYRLCLETGSTSWFAFEIMDSFLGAIYPRGRAIYTEGRIDVTQRRSFTQMLDDILSGIGPSSVLEPQPNEKDSRGGTLKPAISDSSLTRLKNEISSPQGRRDDTPSPTYRPTSTPSDNQRSYMQLLDILNGAGPSSVSEPQAKEKDSTSGAPVPTIRDSSSTRPNNERPLPQGLDLTSEAESSLVLEPQVLLQASEEEDERLRVELLNKIGNLVKEYTTIIKRRRTGGDRR